jgi:dTDP-4-amino-4,6-dideoxygalactose transaminase
MASNGRMSEAQAALALLSLEDYGKNSQLNRERCEQYSSLLTPLPGFHFIAVKPDEKSNYQYVVAEIDHEAFGISRDELVYILQAENILCRRYFTPGLHRCPPYNEQYPHFLNRLPATDILCSRVIQFPSGQLITTEDILTISKLVRYIHDHASDIRQRLRQAQ